MKKNTWKFTKKPGKILEISLNFVSPKKWEPWSYIQMEKIEMCDLS